MVSQTLRTRGSRRRLAVAAAAGTLLLTAACRRGPSGDGASQGDTPVARAVAAVRDRYTAPDALAAGAWAWTAPDSTVWVLVDLQSAVKDLVEGRLDLWSSAGGGVQRIGRSDVMPAAAEFTGFAFEDVTGDGIPDFLGAVSDSAGSSFPIFIPGARGAMSDELELAGHGWQFATGEDNPPQVTRGARGPCAIQLWSDQPSDGAPAGWRWLPIGARGVLGAPGATAPACS